MINTNDKGGEENTMESEIVTVKKTVFRDKCPICSYEIIGVSASQVDFNMKIHLMTHKK